MRAEGAAAADTGRLEGALIDGAPPSIPAETIRIVQERKKGGYHRPPPNPEIRKIWRTIQDAKFFPPWPFGLFWAIGIQAPWNGIGGVNIRARGLCVLCAFFLRGGVLSGRNRDNPERGASLKAAC